MPILLRAAMYTEINGYQIAYKITGSGEKTAVILQGWGTSYNAYESVAEVLRGGFRVVQFDLPGFGQSDEPREPWNVDAYADFFCAFMQKMDIRRATLVGHSYGGRIIIKLAAREALPFEISDIVLIDSAGVLPIRTKKQERQVRRYRFLKKILSTKLIYTLFPEVVDEWRSRQGSADYRNASPVMRQCLVMAVNEDLTELLPKIRQETLLIWGDRDTATPMRDARIMEEKIPGSGLAVIPGAGHFSFLDDPALFRKILSAYLSASMKQ